jgi:hypothetical protein
MTSILEQPIEKQMIRAKREGKTLAQWQAETKLRLQNMHRAAVASLKAVEPKKMTQDEIARFQRKMDSAVI